MKLHSIDGSELMTISALERDGDSLLIKGKVFGAMPMNARLRRRAATPVVPEPKNGSSTRSPALDAASSTR